jgi:hypothetical protein
MVAAVGCDGPACAVAARVKSRAADGLGLGTVVSQPLRWRRSQAHTGDRKTMDGDKI